MTKTTEMLQKMIRDLEALEAHAQGTADWLQSELDAGRVYIGLEPRVTADIAQCRLRAQRIRMAIIAVDSIDE